MTEAAAPIASRIFEVDGEAAFHVHVHVPVLEPDGITWRCSYRLDGPLTKRWRYALGDDSMQALVLALQIISVELELCEENRAGRLGYFAEPGDFGFPAMPLPKASAR